MNRLIANRRPPERGPLQVAEMAVIYGRLYLTSKGDGKTERQPDVGANSVTEIKGNRMGCHMPPSGPQDLQRCQSERAL